VRFENSANSQAVVAYFLGGKRLILGLKIGKIIKVGIASLEARK